MSYPIFPVSPLPAGIDRTFFWNENVNRFDSGEREGQSPYLRPLMRWTVPWKNINEIKQVAIKDFWNRPDIKGTVGAFLMKDPYDFAVFSVEAVRSGYASGSGDVSLFDTNSYFIRADTTTVGSLFSTLSGYVTLGAEYSYDQDTGTLTVNTKAASDVWGVRSAEYFRKCAFASQYRETAVIWNIFNVDLQIEEIV